MAAIEVSTSGTRGSDRTIELAKPTYAIYLISYKTMSIPVPIIL